MGRFLTLGNAALLASCLLYQCKQALCGSRGVTTATPVSLPASQYWDGVDGPWSSFGVLVGTPPQNVRLLPSTSGDSVWVVLPDGCIAGDPSNCASLRGFTFNISNSSTWANEGLFQLFLHTESLLGYSGNALCGYDTVTLGWERDDLRTLEHQVVAGIATKDFYLGSLGLNPRPINFLTFNDPQPSMLQSLNTTGKVPGSSWSYTAGAYNHQPKVFGSLTLGGYDTTRFLPNNVSFPFGADGSRDLSVGIQSITTDSSSSPLLQSGIYAFIDSLVPHIWLPVEACQAFEQAFGLVWDNSSDLYLVSDNLHSQLVELNANVTFKLGPSLVAGTTVDIIMPYRSFDLTASPPIIRRANATKYFPLRRAQNDSQYTLGRAFLQNAYIIADYDRSNFSVSQALFPNVTVPQNLVTILPPGASPPDSGRSGLSTGALAGIVVGSIIVIVCSVAIYVRHHRRRRRRAAAVVASPTEGEEDSTYHKPELEDPWTTHAAIVHRTDSNQVGELDTPTKASGGPLWPQELCDQIVHAAAHELAAEDVLLPELEGTREMETRATTVDAVTPASTPPQLR